MVKPASERLATSLLLLLLTCQIVLAIPNVVGRFGGDEPYYVSKAAYFVAHHRFPRATSHEVAIEQGTEWGTSDWRPQGYPLFVALCSGGDLSAASLRPRITAVQACLIALAIFLVFRALRPHTDRSSMRVLSALILGLAPWPFEFAGLIGPDSLVASVTAIALCLLGRHPRTVFLATLLFATTFTFRPEMIVLPPLIVARAALFQEKHRLGFILTAGLAFLAVFSAHYAYRIDFTGQRVPGIFGGQHIQDRGAFDWVNTWISTESEASNFVFSLTNGQTIPRLPARAFSTDMERRIVASVVSDIQRNRTYSAADDAAFETLAHLRVHQHPFIVVAVHIWHTGHLWINSETNSPLLNAFAHFPRPFRRGLLGAILLLKLTMLAGFVLFLSQRDWRDPFLVLCGLYVLAHTALVGLAIGGFGHRLVVSGWIPLLGCAIAATANFVSRRWPLGDEISSRAVPG
jgi:hypothetical protein